MAPGESRRDALTEFQVVLMAGGMGTRMAPLTEVLPKALFPVANRPLIAYILETFAKAGFQDIIVVSRESQANQMTQFFRSVYPNDGNLRIEQLFVADDIGTADSLRHIKDKIKSDFIVASCDLVTDLPLHNVLDLHRTHNASMTAVAFPMPKLEDGKKQKLDTGTQHFIGVDASGTRLLSFNAAVDLEEDLKLRLGVLRTHSMMRIHTNLSDGHVYVFKRWVLDYLVQRETISTIQGELVPVLTKAQFRNLDAPTGPYAMTSLVPESLFDEPFATYSAVARSAPSKVTCCIYQHTTGTTLRVNTSALYAEANRVVVRGGFSRFQPATRVHGSSELGAKAAVDSHSLVGEGCKIADGASIKRSTVGSHVTIGTNCKLTACILMDYVTVEDGVVLEGCILAQGARVHAQAVLKECEVAAGQTVEAGAKLTKEKIGRDSMDMDEEND